MESVFKTKGQMADSYKVCLRTFNNKLEAKGVFLGKGLISPKDQELIYSVLGFPPNLKIDDKDKKD
jgi:hypothetical protein